MANASTQPASLSPGQRVMHPAHGVGTVGGTEPFEVSGLKLEVLRVTFDDNRMELRVPLMRLATSGLRPLSTSQALDDALEVLSGRPKLGRGMWSRRATDFQAKINSGDPGLVAEVVRDTGRNRDTERSFSERQILEAATDRLACELAAVLGIGRAEAAERVLARISKAAPAAKGKDAAPIEADLADAA